LAETARCMNQLGTQTPPRFSFHFKILWKRPHADASSKPD
jgi:hypothetical protein